MAEPTEREWLEGLRPEDREAAERERADAEQTLRDALEAIDGDLCLYGVDADSEKRLHEAIRESVHIAQAALESLLSVPHERAVEDTDTARLADALEDIVSGDWQRYPNSERHGQHTVEDFAEWALADAAALSRRPVADEQGDTDE